MDVKIRKVSLNDINAISKIYALSWKEAYKGIVPQKCLDECTCEIMNKQLIDIRYILNE